MRLGTIHWSNEIHFIWVFQILMQEYLLLRGIDLCSSDLCSFARFLLRGANRFECVVRVGFRCCLIWLRKHILLHKIRRCVVRPIQIKETYELQVDTACGSQARPWWRLLEPCRLRLQCYGIRCDSCDFFLNTFSHVPKMKSLFHSKKPNPLCFEIKCIETKKFRFEVCRVLNHILFFNIQKVGIMNRTFWDEKFPIGLASSCEPSTRCTSRRIPPRNRRWSCSATECLAMRRSLPGPCKASPTVFLFNSSHPGTSPEEIPWWKKCCGNCSWLIRFSLGFSTIFLWSQNHDAVSSEIGLLKILQRFSVF